MTAFLIADIAVHAPARFMDYVAQVPAFVEKHGGHYRVRGGEPLCQEGGWEPARMVVIEFPSRDHAIAFLNDPGYQPVAAIRHAAATTNLVIADGVE